VIIIGIFSRLRKKTLAGVAPAHQNRRLARRRQVGFAASHLQPQRNEQFTTTLPAKGDATLAQDGVYA
jgi:hypothetical protein